MCGIIGILGKKPVAPLLVDGLKRLEYRGYDSAGIATLEGGRLKRLRARGKLVHLEEKLQAHPLQGQSGIGHTRWATHGVPAERNAHPHMTEKLAVVHNGIIENFAELREELQGKGYQFSSDTDTEIVTHLVHDGLTRGLAPFAAVHESLKRLRGAFALAFLFAGEEDLLIAARKGPPLAIGRGAGEVFVGSDAIALAPFTNRVTYMEDGDCAVLTRESITLYDEAGKKISRAETLSSGSAFLVSKGNHRHFMQKEMFEQPEILSHSLAHYLDLSKKQVKPASSGQEIDWARTDRISFTACGTAYYSTLVAKYWFESLAQLPAENDVASEFRYREPPMPKGTLSFFVSQSGETADTLASLRYCRVKGAPAAALVNVAESTMAREADIFLPSLAGTEVGVASTKAFTAQLGALASLAIAAGKARGCLNKAQEAALVGALAELPRYMNEALRLEKQIEKLCHGLMGAKHALYLGRGTSYPLALEGALKLKELSYIHAEAYAAGELKHGPIALVDEDMPVIVIAPHDKWFEKTVSNMQEVAARGGRIILITDKKGAAACDLPVQATLIMPDMPEIAAPIAYAVPVQLIAYHTAVLLGTDVDQPRNLAKSVTVE